MINERSTYNLFQKCYSYDTEVLKIEKLLNNYREKIAVHKEER